MQQKIPFIQNFLSNLTLTRRTEKWITLNKWLVYYGNARSSVSSRISWPFRTLAERCGQSPMYFKYTVYMLFSSAIYQSGGKSPAKFRCADARIVEGEGSYSFPLGKKTEHIAIHGEIGAGCAA